MCLKRPHRQKRCQVYQADIIDRYGSQGDGGLVTLRDRHFDVVYNHAGGFGGDDDCIFL
jgi:hypothetical protein